MIKAIFNIIYIVSIILGCSSCVSPKRYPKLVPSYYGVDPAVASIVREYFLLSKRYNVQFNNNVTIGFTDLDDPAVASCTRGAYFREIDIDRQYWDYTNNVTHIMLLFHELTHCYCGRNHDYDYNKNYINYNDVNKIASIIKYLQNEINTGFYEDNCPISIMYPNVIDKECALKHYEDYAKEMFSRCIPY